MRLLGRVGNLFIKGRSCCLCQVLAYGCLCHHSTLVRSASIYHSFVHNFELTTDALKG
uniref:Uncharacterized protein n=1 Tax=Picea glauca TaxID=3330 RepID=A0A101M584_PICGL|nr:hypothetical protein ABT39_MTgene1082 [Picea glauca]